jgi:hypothetical protein
MIPRAGKIEETGDACLGFRPNYLYLPVIGKKFHFFDIPPILLCSLSHLDNHFQL